MAASESVSVWIEEVMLGDERAAQQLWDNYFPELVEVARKRLGGLPRQLADEEDVALSALNSFFHAAQRNRFPDLADRHGLWRLLSRITQRKAVNLIRRTLKQSAGGGRVQNETPSTGWRDQAGAALTSELAVTAADEFRRLLDILDDDQLQAIVLAKLEGYTNSEIAERLDIAVRSVERRLNLVRKKWEQELTG